MSGKRWMTGLLMHPVSSTQSWADQMGGCGRDHHSLLLMEGRMAACKVRKVGCLCSDHGLPIPAGDPNKPGPSTGHCSRPPAEELELFSEGTRGPASPSDFQAFSNTAKTERESKCTIRQNSMPVRTGLSCEGLCVRQHFGMIFPPCKILYPMSWV